MVFYIQTKSNQYLENIEDKTNIVFGCKNKICNRKDILLDYKNKIKIKYNNFLIFRKK